MLDDRRVGEADGVSEKERRPTEAGVLSSRWCRKRGAMRFLLGRLTCSRNTGIWWVAEGGWKGNLE